MNELSVGLYSRLSSATALTSLLAGGTAGTSIFDGEAPAQAIFPYVVFNIQGGGDVNDNPHRVKNLVVFVRAYTDDNKKSAGMVDAQIDTLLHLVPFSNITGWTGTWLARERDLENVENPPTGGQIFMQGGLYRVRLAK